MGRSSRFPLSVAKLRTLEALGYSVAVRASCLARLVLAVALVGCTAPQGEADGLADDIERADRDGRELTPDGRALCERLQIPLAEMTIEWLGRPDLFELGEEETPTTCTTFLAAFKVRSLEEKEATFRAAHEIASIDRVVMEPDIDALATATVRVELTMNDGRKYIAWMRRDGAHRAEVSEEMSLPRDWKECPAPGGAMELEQLRALMAGGDLQEYWERYRDEEAEVLADLDERAERNRNRCDRLREPAVSMLIETLKRPSRFEIVTNEDRDGSKRWILNQESWNALAMGDPSVRSIDELISEMRADRADEQADENSEAVLESVEVIFRPPTAAGPRERLTEASLTVRFEDGADYLGWVDLGGHFGSNVDCFSCDGSESTDLMDALRGFDQTKNPFREW